MRAPLVCFALLTVSLSCLFAQDNNTAPPPASAGSAVAAKKSGNVNADLVAARKATAEKRFADSEALMQQVTQSSPNLILPWVELGLAQLGLKKYPEAENSFKTALGIDPASLKRQHADDFYQSTDSAPGKVAPTAVRASRNTAGETVSSGENRTPDVQGVSWAGLGEVYAHENKFAEASAAFDSAAKIYPANAALYRHNETVAFFQAGNSEGQLAAANQAIGLDPTRAANYYFKAQALVSKATLDPQTQKMILPPGCAEAYQKYLELEPNGPYSADAKGILAGAGLPLKAGKK
jgi:tetratricopeptide (TPR) repeat protein